MWKNNGSAVETEPYGESSTTGNEKRRNINGLARAALEREEQLREYRVRIRDMGQFAGRPCNEAAVGEPEPENLADFIRECFAPYGGVELELPPRGPMREPPSFD